jgi:hypothetical protein
VAALFGAAIVRGTWPVAAAVRAPVAAISSLRWGSLIETTMLSTNNVMQTDPAKAASRTIEGRWVFMPNLLGLNWQRVVPGALSG